MAYDSEIYGQSPFGNAPKPDGTPKEGPQKNTDPAAASKVTPPVDDGLDRGPEGFIPPTSTPAAVSTTAAPTTPVNPFSDKKAGEKTVGKWMGKLGLNKIGKPVDTKEGAAGTTGLKQSISSRTTSKSTTKTGTSKKSGKSTRKSSTRKSKKTKAAEAAQAEADALEQAIARRFREEDRSTYLSLLYKTGVSALIWAVLRLSRHEFSDDIDRIINIIIHPLLISLLSLLGVVAITFWLRRLLNDLARHTQQLSADAEETDGKNYRPTLEIVGDSLEYNPKLRKNLAAIFNVASILVCTLISYLIVFTAFP